MIEPKNKKDMTPEELEQAERTFIAYYKISGNATQSAEKSGFRNPRETGFRLKERLLSNDLTNYIDVNKMSLEDQKLWVKQFFANVMSNGKALMKDRISCARTLAEILKMFDSDGKEQEVDLEPLGNLSYEELLKLAKS
jgi:hypothetical protein